MSKSKTPKPKTPKSVSTRSMPRALEDKVLEEQTISAAALIPALVPPPFEELTILYELAQFGNPQKIWDYAERLEKLNPQYTRFTKEIKVFMAERENQEVLDFIQRFLSRTQHYRG